MPIEVTIKTEDEYQPLELGKDTLSRFGQSLSVVYDRIFIQAIHSISDSSRRYDPFLNLTSS